jgi:cytochrome c oxidase subunit II
MKRIKLAVIIGSLIAFATLGEAAAAEAIPVVRQERVIQVTAKVSEYSPHEIVLKKGEPVILELTSQDREHGFRLPDFGIREDIKPGQVARVRLLPQRVGRFSFACDVFCGVDHEEMVGEIVVVD